MDTITFVLCYKGGDQQQADLKVEEFKQSGYAVKRVRGADLVLCDDFQGSPKICNSGGEFDWIVLFASKHTIEDA